MGIYWRNSYGLNEYLAFDEMTSDELIKLSKNRGNQ
jgi:hypothetical protein